MSCMTGPALPVVSIWILDKRSMAEGGASPAEIEAAAETARRDASALARLKHPAVVKVGHTTSLLLGGVRTDDAAHTKTGGLKGASAANFNAAVISQRKDAAALDVS